jgi:hypothetical protein
MVSRASSVAAVAVVAILVGLGAVAASAPFADEAFEQVWSRTDRPVAEGRISRTWLWGPQPFATLDESYDQSPGGKRLVQYFDKSRMEINNPAADRSSPWFVTNGLLAKELATGRLQLGDNRFEERTPARVPVAGDPDDANGPTYATFSRLLDPGVQRVGAVMETVDRAGNVGQAGWLGNYTEYVYYVPETKHNIPAVFWEFLNSSGLIYQSGGYRADRLFEPVFFATGYPISEAYWAQVKVGGETKWVLIQLYERRALTFTPENPPGWQVEMGNIGRHYYAWRYGNSAPQPTQEPQPTEVPSDGELPSAEITWVLSGEPDEQYVEIQNNLDSPLNVRGWKVKLPSGFMYTLPDLTLDVNGLLTIYACDASADEDDDPLTIDLKRCSERWPEEGVAELYDSGGKLVSRYEY